MYRKIQFLLVNKKYLKLLVALRQSQLGTLINLVALSLYVFDKTQSGAAVGFLEIAMAVPSVVLGLFAGTIADRFDRKWIMIISDLIRGVLFLGIGFISDIPIIYVIVFTSSLVGLFFSPACSSAIPLILEKKNLKEANSLSQMSSQLIRFMGPAIAGFLYLQLGFRFICIFNFITYIISAMIILSLAIPLIQCDRQGQKFIKGYLHDIAEGFRYVKSNSLVKWVLLVDGGVQLGAGAIVVLVVMFVKDALNGSDAVYGMIISATAIGSFLGASITWIINKWSEHIILKISLISLGITLMLISFSSQVWFVLLLFAIVGITQTTVSIIVNTLLQKHVRNEVMGRTFATMGIIISVCQLLSMGAGGVLADIIGVRAVYIIGSSIILLMAIMASINISIPVQTEES